MAVDVIHSSHKYGQALEKHARKNCGGKRYDMNDMAMTSKLIRYRRGIVVDEFLNIRIRELDIQHRQYICRCNSKSVQTGACEFRAFRLKGKANYYLRLSLFYFQNKERYQSDCPCILCILPRAIFESLAVPNNPDAYAYHL